MLLTEIKGQDLRFS